MTIRTYKERVSSLAKALPDKSDTEWLIAVYLSLGTAESLGYTRDSFARLDRNARDAVNADMLSSDSFKIPESSEAKRKWLAGHYFNNALFRMVALAEITLKTLFEREMNMKPPDNYWWLVDWYKKNFAKKLDFIGRARERVNKFKHVPRDRTRPMALDTYADGLKAFEELLVLMSFIVEAQHVAQPDASSGSR